MDGVRVGLESVRMEGCSAVRGVRDMGGSTPLLRAEDDNAAEVGAGPVFEGDSDLARSACVSHGSKEIQGQRYQLV
jgi:hypothetical protein